MFFLKVIGHCIIVLSLTILTQVGGLIWLISIFLAKKIKVKKRFVFPVIYLLCNLIIVPPIAHLFGREQLPIFDKNIKPRNIVYPLLFRNYVKPELKELLFEVAKETNINITYLDANFPFIKGFPLLPHLSHNDGKKIDVSFMYLDASGNSTDKKPSVSGYGVFSNAENNTTSDYCIKKGYWQYDITKYISFGTINKLTLDKRKTKIIIEELLKSKHVKKIFIEPHLKESLGFHNSSKIRFHGCRAVRHDDHIHLETN